MAENSAEHLGTDVDGMGVDSVEMVTFGAMLAWANTLCEYVRDGRSWPLQRRLPDNDRGYLDGPDPENGVSWP